MCVFFIKQQPHDYPPDSTFEGAHLPQFLQGIASLISDLRLAIVSIALLYLPTASVTTNEVQEVSPDPGVQHGVVGFQEDRKSVV